MVPGAVYEAIDIRALNYQPLKLVLGLPLFVRDSRGSDDEVVRLKGPSTDGVPVAFVRNGQAAVRLVPELQNTRVVLIPVTSRKLNGSTLRLDAPTHLDAREDRDRAATTCCRFTGRWARAHQSDPVSSDLRDAEFLKERLQRIVREHRPGIYALAGIGGPKKCTKDRFGLGVLECRALATNRCLLSGVKHRNAPCSTWSNPSKTGG